MQLRKKERKKKDYSINYVISFATWQTCRMHTFFFLLSITRQLNLWNIARIPITDTLHRSQLLRKPSLLCCSQNVKSSWYALACKSPATTVNVFQWNLVRIAKRLPTERLLFQICSNMKLALLPPTRGTTRTSINSRLCSNKLHATRQRLRSCAGLWASDLIHAFYSDSLQ